MITDKIFRLYLARTNFRYIVTIDDNIYQRPRAAFHSDDTKKKENQRNAYIHLEKFGVKVRKLVEQKTRQPAGGMRLKWRERHRRGLGQQRCHGYGNESAYFRLRLQNKVISKQNKVKVLTQL